MLNPVNDLLLGCWKAFVLGLVFCCGANHAIAQTNTEPSPKTAFEVPVPDWVAKAVFYQVFPERFWNGDPNNDPDRLSLEFPESVPKSWTVSLWDGDWYAREPWELETGPDFYSHGVFNRRYGGDLQGIIDKLDYLQDLGINAIYLNPIFYGRSLHKYDGNSFHHVDPYFGPDPQGDLQIMQQETPDPATWQWTAADKLFLHLLTEARRREIRVVLDGVFNHCGRDFFAFKDLREKQADSEYVDWFTVYAFDDPNTEADEFSYDCWWGVKTLPKFRQTAEPRDLHPGPKQYIFAATQRWMDPNQDGDPSDGVAGWRLDVAGEMPTKFWRDWHAHVRKINPDVYTVAEIWDDASPAIPETHFASTMNYFGFAYPVKGFLIDAQLSAREFSQQLAQRREAYPLSIQHALLNLIDSHDTDRVASMIVNAVSPTNDKGREYLQAHRFDYGMRERISPRNDRSYQVSRPSPEQREIQKLVAVFQLTYIGTPMIYYGTEAGMWGANDPDCRQPMIFPDSPSRPMSQRPTFNRRRQNTESESSERPNTTEVADETWEFDQELHNFYRRLIRIRRERTELNLGTFNVLMAENQSQLFIFERRHEATRTLVAINRHSQPATFEYELPTAEAQLHKLLSTFEEPVWIQPGSTSNHRTLHLPPTGAIIIGVE